MVIVKIERKDGFRVVGIKTWISGTDNEQFAQFWSEQHQNGNVEELKKYNTQNPDGITKSTILGLSDTTKDPNLREFDFYIAVETDEKTEILPGEFESIQIKPLTWAIFSCMGNTIESLMKCEMYCWSEWLPNNEYVHDYGPEMEVYFNDRIEYWIPVKEKNA